MGADISQSQQLRNLYPLSQYKILPNDPHFNNLTIIQRIHDSAVFAVATQQSAAQYIDAKSPYVIKKAEKHQIHKKTIGMYEWATANVYGLVQYVTHIDKSRKISGQQYKSIVQGSIRAYSALASTGSELDCLKIKMQNLRIFNQVNIKRNALNQKQVVNSLMIKVIPTNLNQKQKRNSQVRWKHVGQCIHRDGILTEKQLLGQYLLQLSNYATKSDYQNNNDSLAKASQQFGAKYEKIIRALLDNQSWAKVCGLLSLQEQAKKQPEKKVDQKNVKRQDNKQNKPSEKTMPGSNQNISQQNLFKVFGNQGNLPLTSQLSILQNNTSMRSRITSIGNFKSLSPLKTQRMGSPPSIKIIREVTPPKVNKNNQPSCQNDYSTVPKIPTPQLQKVSSRLVVHPDILQQTTHYYQNDRRPSMYQQSKYFSPRQQKSGINYFNSPQKVQKQDQPLRPQKRKGKKILFEASTINKPLQINLQQYITKYQQKSFPDTYNQQQKKRQDTKKESQTSFFEDNLFDSKQFNKKYSQNFLQKNDNQQLIKSFAKAPPKQKIGGKDESKVKHIQFNIKNNFKNVLNNESLGIKQTQSEQMIIIDPNQKKVKQVISQNPPTQSRYIGTMNMNGQKQGQGKLYFPSGGSYVGQFYKDFMHGKGKLYYPSGRLAYDGVFKYDKFHDHGKLYNQNPKHIHTFDFRNFNKLEVTQKQQPIHREHHLINPIQKQKKLSYWKYYEGQMSHDMKHGKGVLVLENGQKYQGQFKNDLVSGVGVFHGKNGNISGRWDDNLLAQVYR